MEEILSLFTQKLELKFSFELQKIKKENLESKIESENRNNLIIDDNNILKGVARELITKNEELITKNEELIIKNNELISKTDELTTKVTKLNTDFYNLKKLNSGLSLRKILEFVVNNEINSKLIIYKKITNKKNEISYYINYGKSIENIIAYDNKFKLQPNDISNPLTNNLEKTLKIKQKEFSTISKDLYYSLSHEIHEVGNNIDNFSNIVYIDKNSLNKYQLEFLFFLKKKLTNVFTDNKIIFEELN